MYYYNINNYQPDVTNHLRVCNNRKCDIPVLGFQVERSYIYMRYTSFQGFSYFLYSAGVLPSFLVQFGSRAFPSYLIESCLGFLGWKTSVLLHRISSMSGMPRVLQAGNHSAVTRQSLHSFISVAFIFLIWSSLLFLLSKYRPRIRFGYSMTLSHSSNFSGSYISVIIIQMLPDF